MQITLTDMLLQGPRGRRLLLEYARAAERLHDPEYSESSFGSAVFYAAHHLEPEKGTSYAIFGWAAGEPEPELKLVTPAEAAALLTNVPLSAEAVAAELLRQCLVESVDAARYWQEPDGEDLLAATPDMRQALTRIAEHVATSAAAVWWCTPTPEHSQHAVRWNDTTPREVVEDPLSVLRAARTFELEEELVARRERPVDPSANWGGEWWSRPPWEMASSTRKLFDGSPASLWFVEDSLGWEAAETQRVGVPAGLRVYEIDTAHAWAELCVRFPLDVTAQKRHDWYRATGRAGRWVIPDWAEVAEHYDAVHLQVGAYLAAPVPRHVPLLKIVPTKCA